MYHRAILFPSRDKKMHRGQEVNLTVVSGVYVREENCDSPSHRHDPDVSEVKNMYE